MNREETENMLREVLRCVQGATVKEAKEIFKAAAKAVEEVRAEIPEVRQ